MTLMVADSLTRPHLNRTRKKAISVTPGKSQNRRSKVVLHNDGIGVNQELRPIPVARFQEGCPLQSCTRRAGRSQTKRPRVAGCPELQLDLELVMVLYPVYSYLYLTSRILRQELLSMSYFLDG